MLPEDAAAVARFRVGFGQVEACVEWGVAGPGLLAVLCSTHTHTHTHPPWIGSLDGPTAWAWQVEAARSRA